MQRMNKQYYQQTVMPALQKQLGIANIMAVPGIKKVIVNMGVTQPQDPKARLQICQNITEQFAAITGQKPQITRAKKSISTFKLRQGDPVGVMVTLRGDSMWQFLQRLVIVALPRVKDFRGVSRAAFDARGTYSMGIEEQIVFPEINYDTIDRIRPLQVVIVTSATKPAHALALLEALGMPFAKEE